MATIKLTYFDIDGGRAEPIRLILRCAGLAFEDFRFGFNEFDEIRKTTPFGQVPTVELDGEVITQTNALCRYFGKLAGLYPEDVYQALLCDEVMDAIDDTTAKVVATLGLSGDALKTAREALAAGPLTLYLKWLQARLIKQGGDYFADNRLTIADIKVFVFARSLVAGQMDHVPTSLVKDVAPAVFAHIDRVASYPPIAAYYDGRK